MCDFGVKIGLVKKTIVGLPGKRDVQFVFELVKPYLTPQAKILDVGCWNGEFIFNFCQEIQRSVEGEDCAVVGIDINKEALEIAVKIAAGRKNISFKNVSALSLKDNLKEGFDLCFFLDVIEHLPKNTEEKALFQINQVLTKGGVLVLSVYNHHPLVNLLDPAYFLGHRHYSISSLNRMLEKNNYRVLKTYQKAGFIELFSAIVLYIFKYIFKRRRPEIFERLLSWEMKQKKGFVKNFIIAQKI